MVNILVIDDEIGRAKEVCDILRSEEEYNVSIVLNKDSAIELARNNMPSLIFIKAIRMEADEFDIVKEIRKNDVLKDVPIIMLTETELDYSDISEIKELRPEYMIADVLKMPVEKNILINKIRKVAQVEYREKEIDKISSKIESESTDTTAETELSLKAIDKDTYGIKGSNITDFVIQKTKSRKIPVLCGFIAIFIMAPLVGYFFYPDKINIKSLSNQIKKVVMGKPEPEEPHVTILEPPLEEPPLKIEEEPLPEKPLEKNIAKPSDKEKVTIKETKKEEIEPKIKKVPPVSKSNLKRGIFSAQAGVFSEENNAKSYMNYLKEKGYNSFMKKVTFKDSFKYRVLVGEYKSRKDALEMANRLKKEENIDAFPLYH